MEPMNGPTNEHDYQGAFQNLTHHFRGGFEMKFVQGYVGGDSHHEQEEREDQIAGSESVPFGMAQRDEGFAPSAVIYQYHAGYGQPSQYIQ
jgi:hypothetical protein